jgi:hypothetical protein
MNSSTQTPEQLFLTLIFPRVIADCMDVWMDTTRQPGELVKKMLTDPLDPKAPAAEAEIRVIGDAAKVRDLIVSLANSPFELLRSVQSCGCHVSNPGGVPPYNFPDLPALSDTHCLTDYATCRTLVYSDYITCKNKWQV